MLAVLSSFDVVFERKVASGNALLCFYGLCFVVQKYWKSGVRFDVFNN